ncbi:hypothetical protein ACFYNL_35735 [Streptomyces sp. NPDC007808]|uniref:hypothetical protein n=1 Tax=Streptomyces sp. NPDC007808 TaxID=3364779 RepID=UPI0036B0032F
MRDEAERLLSALRARVDRWARGADPAGVLDEQASRDWERLIAIAQAAWPGGPPVRVVVVFAELLRCRYSVDPERRIGDLYASTGLFALIYARDPGSVPEQLRPFMATSVIASSDPDAWGPLAASAILGQPAPRIAADSRPTSADGTDRAAFLSWCGNRAGELFEELRVRTDLDDSVRLCHAAVEVAASDHPHRAALLQNLAVALKTRADHTRSLDDLRRSIDAGREALAACVDDVAVRTTVLTSHGTTLLHHFERTGRLDDLQQAISLFEEAIDLLADGPHRAKARSLLSTALLRRCETTGNPADLDRSAVLGRQALDGLPADDGGRPAVQTNLGVVLRTRYERFGKQDDLQQAIELLRGAIDAMPADHPDRPAALADLGNAYVNRSVQRTSAQDLDEGITLLRAAADSASPADRGWYSRLGQLGGALYQRFIRLQELQDIDDAIHALQSAAGTVPSTHIDRRPILNTLGSALQVRYTVTEDPEDLERAHRTLLECLRISPVGGPDHAGVLSNLASTLYHRADLSGRPEDLTEAIDAVRTAVDTIAPENPARPSMLVKLSLLLRSRFHAEDRADDLDQAVDAALAALRAPVSERPDRAYESMAAAHALTDRFARNATVADAFSAVELLRDVARDATADVYARLSAARSAGDLIALINGRPGAAADDYDMVELLPLLAWHGLGRSSRERLLSHWPRLVREATAASTDARRIRRAVEQLEQGRAVLWSQLLATRGDLTRLWAEHPELAERLAGIREELDRPSPAWSEQEPVVPVPASHAQRPEPPRILPDPLGPGQAEPVPASSASGPRPADGEQLHALTEAVNRRVSVYVTRHDPGPVLSARATEEAQTIMELARVAGGDPVDAVAALHAVAWLRWHRGRELPEEQAAKETIAALELFEHVWGVGLEEVAPSLVSAELAARPRESRPETGSADAAAAPVVLGIAERALRTRDRVGLARAAADLGRLAGHISENDPFRPLCSAHASRVHLSRFGESQEDADLDEAIRCARDVVATGHSPVLRLIGLSVLGNALLVGSEASGASAGDTRAFDEAVPLLREAVALAESVEGDQLRNRTEPEVTAHRGQRLSCVLHLVRALLARYRSRGAESDLDEAVGVCLTIFGLLTPDRPDHPGARHVVSSVLEEVNKRSDRPDRMEQALLLCQGLIALTGMPTPSETTTEGEAVSGPGAAGAGRAPADDESRCWPPDDLPAAATYATDLAFGSAAVAATVVDDSDADRYLSTVGRICRTGGVVLVQKRPAVLREEEEGGASGPLDLESLVESVGDCAAVPLSVVDGLAAGLGVLPGGAFSPLIGVAVFPCLLAGVATVRTLLSDSGVVVPDTLMRRSRPVRADFRQWAHLWAPENGEEPAASVMERLRRGDGHGVLAYAVAELLATGHRNGVLHGDARWESFGWVPERGKAVIIEHAARFLCRPPTPAQCATDLAPLLPSLSPSAWRAFRLGYLHHWPEGRSVIDLVEYGDTTGWVRAMARQDMPAAATLLGEAFDRCPPSDEVGRMVITANLAQARSRIGLHDQACAGAEAAWKASRSLAPDFTPLLALHAGLVRLRAGDRDAATQTMLALTIGSNPPHVSELAMRVIRHLFPGTGAPAALPDEGELPFIARKGDGLLPMAPFGQGDQEER